MPPWPRTARDLERSGCPFCIHTSVRPSEDQVQIFVQGRISRPINGCKLTFHMRMYLYDTSRHIQEPWPHGLYFTVHWFRTRQIIKVKILSKVDSQDLWSSVNGSKLIFHMRWISKRSAGMYKSHDLLTYIPRSAGCKPWPIFHG